MRFWNLIQGNSICSYYEFSTWSNKMNVYSIAQITIYYQQSNRVLPHSNGNNKNDNKGNNDESNSNKNGKLNKKRPNQDRERKKNVYICFVCVCCMLKSTLYNMLNAYLEHSKSIDVFHSIWEWALWPSTQQQRKERSRVSIENGETSNRWLSPIHKKQAIYRKNVQRVVDSVSDSRIHRRIHFVCIKKKKKYVYEWRNQFGYLELIINSQI